MAGAGTGQQQLAVQPQGGQAGGQTQSQPNSTQYSKAVMSSDYGAPASGGKGGIGGVLPQISNLGNSAMQGMVSGGMQQPQQQAASAGQPYQVGGTQQSAQYPVDMNYTKYSGQQQPQAQTQPATGQGSAPPNIFNTAAQGMNQSIKAAGMETMYRPQTIAGTDLSAYTNPYETQVVQNTMSDLDRQRQIEANQLAAQATARGAFGGSRDALMQSELSRNYGQQMANTATQLRQAGFQNAQQMAGQDIGYGLQGSQNRQQAASTLGQLSNLGFGQGMQLNEQAMQQGALSQGINQMIIDAAKGQYAGYQGAPAQSLSYMSQALGATPTPTTTTQSRNPGLFDYLTLGASMYPKK